MEDLLMSSINLKTQKKKKAGNIPGRIKEVFEVETKNEVEKETEQPKPESEQTEKPKRAYKRKTKATPKLDPEPIDEDPEVADDE